MKLALPKPMSTEDYQTFYDRAMADENMLREYPSFERRSEVASARWAETQFSQTFYVPEVETPTESEVSTPRHSKGKTMAEPGEPLTDPETQRTT